MKVNVMFPRDSWILNKFGKELISRLKYCTANDPNLNAYDINYYINYNLFKRKSKGIDIAHFTHIEESKPKLIEKYWQVAQDVDYCVCMSSFYEEIMESRGHKVVVIPPGIDEAYKAPYIKVGWVGKTANAKRKGVDLLNKVKALPWVDLRITEGKIPEKDMPKFYEEMDYILVTSMYEGGPMCILEAMAMGKDIIAPEGVGYVNDFGDSMYTYEKGNWEELHNLLEQFHTERFYTVNDVEGWTWDNFAEEHDALFKGLLNETESRK